jgi:hypothetical protein
MDISCEAEIYAPAVDESGKYVDSIPPNCRYGIRCPCSSRRDKIYENNKAFSNHLRTKMHVKWLEELNNNRSNYFVENIRLQETIKNQQQIIAKLEIEIKNKILTIDYLTNILLSKEKKELNYKPESELEINLLDL